MSEMTTTIDKTDILTRLKVRREVARASDGYYTEAEKLAERMRQAKLKTDQVRGLENVAYATEKVSDVLDLVKKQIGRGRWPLELGEDMLATFGRMQPEARRIAKGIDSQDSDLPRRVHLLLCREYIKHLAAHFIYQLRLRGEEEER